MASAFSCRTGSLTPPFPEISLSFSPLTGNLQNYFCLPGKQEITSDNPIFPQFNQLHFAVPF
jgi:hypothetical protein